CREQGIAAYVGIKFPPTSDWLNSVEDYFQSGLAHQIYDCSLGKAIAKDSSFSTNPPSGWNKVILESSGQLQHEYFLVLLAPELSVALIGQEVGPTSSVSLSLTPRLKLNYSLLTSTIEQIVRFLKQRVTITDRTPEELSSDSVLNFPLRDQLSSSLVTQLLHHQIKALVNLPALVQPIPVVPSSLEPWLDDPQFLINVIRELSLPLTNIKTALSLLDSMQHKREQRQRYLDLLQRECDRQTSLIAGLQELGQLNHPIDEKDKIVRLEDCIPGVVSTYQPLAEEKGISLGYNIPAGLPSVLCPTPWLRQMLQHLLHNSLKFTPPQGKVYVRVTLQGDRAEIAVSDTGIGIEMSDLPKLFHYFYRGRNALGAETAGAGFGCAIVQQ
ncbi:MAG: ATP-binding protein, partial [Microcystaceae cyanobacterium]